MYFLTKGIRLSVWEPKDINIGRSDLTNINFACIGNTKFIDTMKHYQNILGELASTLTLIEKNRVEVLTKQFLMQNGYFLKTWLMLTEKQKNQVLNIIVSGKGVIPYKKLMRLTLCKKNQKMGYFFRKKTFLAHSRGKQIMMMIMRIEENCLFY